MSGAVFQYKRVRVFEGKHGAGDYRIEFNGEAPTHGELLAMLAWVFRAEDRYAQGMGRRLFWLHLKEAIYGNGMPLRDVIENADGPYDWEAEGIFT